MTIYLDLVFILNFSFGLPSIYSCYHIKKKNLFLKNYARITSGKPNNLMSLSPSKQFYPINNKTLIRLLNGNN